MPVHGPDERDARTAGPDDVSSSPGGGFGELVDTILRLALLAVLVAWCYRIIAPFLDLLVFGVILAVAFRPLQLRLAGLVGGRTGLAAGLVAALLLAVLVVPLAVFSTSVVDGAELVTRTVEKGEFSVPRPDIAVADWPIVGAALHRLLEWLATNTEAVVGWLAPHLKSLGASVVGALGRGGLAVLKFIAATVLAAVLLSHAGTLVPPVQRLARRLAGSQGESNLDLAVATIRSVFKGVIGVAAIQGVLAGIGIFAIGVPAAGLWSMLVLVLAIVQVPPLLVLGPMIIWAFATLDTLPAVLFTVWSVVVSVSDGFLKPALLGRGVSVPMLVILVGAIGGMLASGIIGLFIGPVVLALAYKLTTAWLAEEPADPPHAR